MKITIHQPAGFNEKGGRSNNEDSIYPLPGMATSQDRMFLVCDGVGGEHKGEVASAMACQSVSGYFLSRTHLEISQEEVKDAVESTRRGFAKMEASDPETHGMATTMTMLFLAASGVVVAHMGDSRIYQVRDGKIIFQTKDHKWVNELVESGVITQEQAIEHPKRNVITRVIGADRHDQPDFKLIEDVQPNDFFFMCTDGVLEQLYDQLLEYHLGGNNGTSRSVVEIVEAIREECDGKTNDNFSAYLIKIESTGLAGSVLSDRTINAGEILESKVNDTGKSSGRNGVFFTISVVLGLLLFGGIAFYPKPKQKEETFILKSPNDTVAIVPKATLAKPGAKLEEIKIAEGKPKSVPKRIEKKKVTRKTNLQIVSTDNSKVVIHSSETDTTFEEGKNALSKSEVMPTPEIKPAVVKTETPVLPKRDHPH